MSYSQPEETTGFFSKLTAVFLCRFLWDEKRQPSGFRGTIPRFVVALQLPNWRDRRMIPVEALTWNLRTINWTALNSLPVLLTAFKSFDHRTPGCCSWSLRLYVEKHRNSIWPKRPMVYDIGAGTGILTRQLRSMLGGQFGIRGVEPNRDMREAARKNTPTELDIDYTYGVAERLPIEDGKASVIVVAQAIHWFNRARFYREVRRGLHVNGVLAIMQNDRGLERQRIGRCLRAILGSYFCGL